MKIHIASRGNYELNSAGETKNMVEIVWKLNEKGNGPRTDHVLFSVIILFITHHWFFGKYVFPLGGKGKFYWYFMI